MPRPFLHAVDFNNNIMGADLPNLFAEEDDE